MEQASAWKQVGTFGTGKIFAMDDMRKIVSIDMPDFCYRAVPVAQLVASLRSLQVSELTKPVEQLPPK